MAYTPEPIIRAGKDPEASLQASLVAETQALLDQSKLQYVLMESFGLDLAFLIGLSGQTVVKFIEVKAFVGSRQGGVGIGTGAGRGSQIDLLINPTQTLEIADQTIAWVLGIGELPMGKPRYALFSSREAKAAAMGGVIRGKQNNLRVNDFREDLATWDELSGELGLFLHG